MRIRKRSVPLPFSLLSPTALPVSDPSLISEGGGGEAEEEEEEKRADQSDKTHIHPHHQSDSSNQSLRLTIIRRKNGWIFSEGDAQEKKGCCMFPSPSPSPQALQLEEPEKEQEHGELEEEKKKRWREKDNIRNESRLGDEANSRVQQHSSLPSNQVGRWVEGEKLIPLKKRRGNFERKVKEETMVEKEKKMKSKLKTKATKKWVHEKDQEEEEKVNGLVSTNVNQKKGIINGTDGPLMEGSRCSRVNGRGWRCCQQTLVGYSLCEHHLGKGRLRSMSTNHTSFGAITGPKKVLEREEEDQEEPLIKHIEKKKKKTKMGIVKTRSISSLLGQTHHSSNVAVQPLPACNGMN